MSLNNEWNSKREKLIVSVCFSTWMDDSYLIYELFTNAQNIYRHILPFMCCNLWSLLISKYLFTRLLLEHTIHVSVVIYICTLVAKVLPACSILIAVYSECKTYNAALPYNISMKQFSICMQSQETYL